MDLSLNNNENFVELEETVLDEVNGGGWQWVVASYIVGGLWNAFQPIPVY